MRENLQQKIFSQLQIINVPIHILKQRKEEYQYKIVVTNHK